MFAHGSAPRGDGEVVGYVSGVFDMFHIGHLNIIVNARERCHRLVVGVVTDEVVLVSKSRAPVIPLSERVAILRGLRDVDEVVIDRHVDKFDTWKELQYDVIFKGDDWRGTPKGSRLEGDLATVGARVEYFPYTRHTSSTLLREVLTKLAHTPVQPLPAPFPGVRPPDAPSAPGGRPVHRLRPGCRPARSRPRTWSLATVRARSPSWGSSPGFRPPAPC